MGIPPHLAPSWACPAQVYASPKVCARAADPKVKAPKWPKRV